MRYYNYLNEDKDLIELLNNNSIVDFYKQSRNYYLFRGIKDKINTYKIITARTDRKPRDTPLEMHHRLDKAFHKKFGWKPRSEGVFVAGNYSEAKYYGIPQLFIPLNPFEYIHSNHIKDLYAHLEETGYVDEREEVNYLPDEEIDKIVKTYKKNADLYEIVINNSEVMFKCKQYILMNINYFEKISREFL